MQVAGHRTQVSQDAGNRTQTQDAVTRGRSQEVGHRR